MEGDNLISTVTLNPAIDKTLILNELKIGKVNRVLRNRENIGGKGINVSKILSKFDHTTNAIAILGHDNLEFVKSLILKANLKVEYYEVNGLTRTNTKIVDLANNTTTDINEMGFEIQEDNIPEIISFIVKNIIKSNYIVLSGSVPKWMPNDIYSQIIESSNINAKFIIDTEGEQLINVLKNKPFLIKPNIHELEEALNIKLKSDEDIINTCLNIIDIYDVENILVSMGGDGSILVAKDIILKAEPIKVELRSTVGAGDSLVAGFIHGLIEHDMNKIEALKFGTACGTLAVSKESIDDLDKFEVKKMIESIIIRKL
ncbi:MAG: 1-phosphofructokinase [Tissierellales bacterium]|nr:1-phosphofructokinase [Tissierellales bacterium]